MHPIFAERMLSPVYDLGTSSREWLRIIEIIFGDNLSPGLLTQPLELCLRKTLVGIDS